MTGILQGTTSRPLPACETPANRDSEISQGRLRDMTLRFIGMKQQLRWQVVGNMTRNARFATVNSTGVLPNGSSST